MANEQNLIPVKDSNIARALQEKSAKKRSQNVKERKLIRQGLEERMKIDFDAYIDSIFVKAIKHKDTKAWELIRDTLGEKPAERIEQAIINPYGNLSEEELKKLADDAK